VRDGVRARFSTILVLDNHMSMIIPVATTCVMLTGSGGGDMVRLGVAASALACRHAF
jgi:hypothetical protein